jgi:glycyl-tRNA synthetase beta chain
LVEEGIVTSSPLPFRGGAGGGGAPDGAAPAAIPHPNPSPEGEGLGKAQLADMVEQAARLCKADLVTEMVGEFPELQGIMGGYYARAEGLSPQVADAIRDHYKPVGQGDDVPTAPVTVAVSLADKLDTLVAFFLIQEKPTGSKDPFALRRAGISIGRLIVETGIRANLILTVMQAMFGVFRHQIIDGIADVYDEIGPIFRHINDPDLASKLLLDVAPKSVVANEDGTLPVSQNAREAAAMYEVVIFLFDRLKVQQREAGVRHDLIDAVFALGGEDDLVRLLARVHALQSFVATDDGVNLLAGYKRAANILKKEAPTPVTPAKAGVSLSSGAEEGTEMPASAGMTVGEYEKEPAEASLLAALDAAEPRAAKAIADERFEDAMAALATLRAPIDAFFETVTVNDADPAKRTARLALLDRVRAAVHGVADFSKIAG